MTDLTACRCCYEHMAISPFHEGHCCFWPATQTCHPDEVAAWEAKRDELNRRVGR